MNQNGNNKEVVRRTVMVPVSIERAFSRFTANMISWWPIEYTFYEHDLDTIRIELRRGGRWYERDSEGKESDWGKVLMWNPPHQVVLSWQISHERKREPDPEKASVVDIRFISEGNSKTRIDLEHRDFHRHGEGAEVWRTGMDSPEGWTKILDAFCDVVSDE